MEPTPNLSVRTIVRPVETRIVQSWAGLVLALMLCTLAWLAPSADSESAIRTDATSVSPLGGVNVDGLDYRSLPVEADRTIAHAQQLHARIVRAAFPWSALEPAGSDQIDPQALAFTDRLINDAAAAGIRVIAATLSTPCWATSAPSSLQRRCIAGHPSAANSWPPRRAADYSAFVAYLANRYGSRLAAIEVWNEPDQINQLYLAGPHKAARYAAILRAAYPAIKRADPNVPVLAGSLVGSNGVFLRALYASGIKGYYDGLAVHFYTLTLAALRAIHEVQLANHDATPLWLDEFGWSSCWPRYRRQQEQSCVTEQLQGANLADIFHSLAHTNYVAAEVVSALQGSTGEDFGVLSGTGARKPAFYVLAGLLASPFGAAHPVTLSLRQSGGRVVARGSGPVGDYMRLEAFQGSLLRYRAVFTLDRFNRYSIVLPAALGNHGLRVRVFQYWGGPGQDAQRSI